jgi:hypothetical protein
MTRSTKSRQSSDSQRQARRLALEIAVWLIEVDEVT